MLYVGFIYGNWEVGGLVNVIEELELYKQTVRKDRSGPRLVPPSPPRHTHDSWTANSPLDIYHIHVVLIMCFPTLV